MTSAPLSSAPLTSAVGASPISGAGPGARGEPRLRLSVKSVGSGVTGQVDGAWWPYSSDLVGELDVLVPALAERLGRIEGVSYGLAEWNLAARKVDIGGTRVRLGGFHSIAAHTVDVLAEQHRATLLVIPPDTPPELASAVLTAAGTDGNANSVDELLAAAPPDDIPERAR
jgi:hypothetical protein